MRANYFKISLLALLVGAAPLRTFAIDAEVLGVSLPPPTPLTEKDKRTIARYLVTAPGSQPTSPGVNLVPNPGFEDGEKWPATWAAPLDNLTVFWTEMPDHGKVIKMDSDVNLSDWERRQGEIKANPDAPPRPKRPTKWPKYGTIGGTEGVKLYSAPMPVKRGMKYLVSCDLWTDEEKDGMFVPKLFVRGYGTLAGKERKLYDTYINCRRKSGGWHHHEQDFNATMNTPAVTHVRIMLYAYWPPGVYVWDNIAIKELEMDPRYKTLDKHQATLPGTRKAIHFEDDEDEENKHLFELMDLIEKNPPKNIWIDTIILKDGKIALRVLGDTQKIIEDYTMLVQIMDEVESAKIRKIGAPFRKEVKRQVFEALIDVAPKQK